MSLFGHLPDPEPNRVLIWFSCGVTSAVAAKLALVDYPQAQVVRIVIKSEHEDSDRFAADVARWLKRPIVKLLPKLPDQFAVIEKERYVNGPTGAKCSAVLKMETRVAYQRSGDLHIFGFDAGEADRVEDFRETFPDLWFKAPLVEAGLAKPDCKGIVERAGIALPAMYRLGYSNNNCIGCSKGGMGYWNRIRIDFPPFFARMAKAERVIGHTVLRHRSGPLKGQSLYLDELDPKAGRFEEGQPAGCGPLCEAAVAKMESDQ